jgi:hypothetical protein
MELKENEIAIEKVKASGMPDHLKETMIKYHTKLDSFGTFEFVPDLEKYDDFHPIHAMARF